MKKRYAFYFFILLLFASHNINADIAKGIDFIKSYQTSEGGWGEEDFMGLFSFRALAACEVFDQNRFITYNRLRASQGFTGLWAGNTPRAIWSLIESGEDKNSPMIRMAVDALKKNQPFIPSDWRLLANYSQQFTFFMWHRNSLFCLKFLSSEALLILSDFPL